MKLATCVWRWSTLAMITALLSPPLVSAGETKKVPARTEIEKKYLWATEDIFKDTAAWEAEFTALEGKLKEVAALKGTLSKGPAELLAACKLRDDVEARIDRVQVYASLLSDQDTTVGKNQELDSRATSLAIKYGQATAWWEPELTTVPFEQLGKWMGENKDLALYRHYLDDLFRQKKHILSPREEELIAMAGEVFRTPSSAYNLLTNADLKFPTIKDEKGNDVELSDSAFYLYMRAGDRKVRKAAYEAIVSTYAKVRNSAAALLNGQVQAHVFTVKARGYSSCLAAALDGGNIPPQVYQTLVDTVNENLPLLHRYAAMRKKPLGITDGIRDYDLYTPLIEEQSLEYNYEQAVEMITAALQPLGKGYLDPMAKGFGSRWVDVFPTMGKRSGAYSSGTFLTQPYILLNFHGTYDSVSTLAHEMGHSMHSFYSRGTQPYVYISYDIFCAEVASTCNEILLQHYILDKTKDPKQKLFLVSEFLETMRGTIFRQTMFSEFEQRIHALAEEGKPLTADVLGAEYGGIMKKYYGPDYAHDPLVDEYWIRIPHFYYNFYVYKYATSYCAAANIARRILAKEPGAVEAYMQFLQAGSSEYAIDVLKMAKVDMTSPEVIRDGIKLFKDMLDQADALLAEVNKGK